MPGAFDLGFEDLPRIIPIFPLSGALLLPQGKMPLNIFEPRYLNMVDDAMAGDRIIGLVQPKGGTPALPGLSPVGCAGRITGFAETSDGRYLITLTGVSRFRIAAEWARDDLIATRSLVESGALSLAGLITHQATATDAPSAYRTAFDDPACLKMILNWKDAA